jgi:hypothetical protein
MSNSTFKSYDIEAIKARLNAAATAATKKSSTDSQQRSKISFWKPEVTQPDQEHEIRFLPITVAFNNENEPFQQVLYYDKFCKNRLIAPFQFSEADPVKEMEQKLLKSKDRAKRSLLRYFNSKERYYAVLIVRGQEDKGPQLWEMSKELCYNIYKTSFVHKNYKNANLLDPDKGQDFTVSVTPQYEKDGSVKTYNGHPCKEYVVAPLVTPSKIHENEETQKKILAAIPDLQSYFKAQVKTPEQITETIENFIAQLDAGVAPEQAKVNLASVREEQPGTESLGTDQKKTNGVSSEAAVVKAEADIEAAFSHF